jgi:hypothetical protein
VAKVPSRYPRGHNKWVWDAFDIDHGNVSGTRQKAVDVAPRQSTQPPMALSLSIYRLCVLWRKRHICSVTRKRRHGGRITAARRTAIKCGESLRSPCITDRPLISAATGKGMSMQNDEFSISAQRKHHGKSVEGSISTRLKHRGIFDLLIERQWPLQHV